MKFFGNAHYVDQQTYINRLKICETCDHSISVIPLAGKTCSVCGCFVKAKTRYKKSQCPDTPPRWLAIPINK